MADGAIPRELRRTAPIVSRESRIDLSARLRACVGSIDARARALIGQANRSRLVVQHGERKIVDLPLTAVAALGLVGVVVSPLAMVAAVAFSALERVNARVES